jgi:hypothetical protein
VVVVGPVDGDRDILGGIDARLARRRDHHLAEQTTEGRAQRIAQFIRRTAEALKGALGANAGMQRSVDLVLFVSRDRHHLALKLAHNVGGERQSALVRPKDLAVVGSCTPTFRPATPACAAHEFMVRECILRVSELPWFRWGGLREAALVVSGLFRGGRAGGRAHQFRGPKRRRIGALCWHSRR